MRKLLNLEIESDLVPENPDKNTPIRRHPETQKRRNISSDIYLNPDSEKESKYRKIDISAGRLNITDGLDRIVTDSKMQIVNFYRDMKDQINAEKASGLHTEADKNYLSTVDSYGPKEEVLSSGHSKKSLISYKEGGSLYSTSKDNQEPDRKTIPKKVGSTQTLDKTNRDIGHGQLAKNSNHGELLSADNLILRTHDAYYTGQIPGKTTEDHRKALRHKKRNRLVGYGHTHSYHVLNQSSADKKLTSTEGDLSLYRQPLNPGDLAHRGPQHKPDGKENLKKKSLCKEKFALKLDSSSSNSLVNKAPPDNKTNYNLRLFSGKKQFDSELDSNDV